MPRKLEDRRRHLAEREGTVCYEIEVDSLDSRVACFWGEQKTLFGYTKEK